MLGVTAGSISRAPGLLIFNKRIHLLAAKKKKKKTFEFELPSTVKKESFVAEWRERKAAQRFAQLGLQLPSATSVVHLPSQCHQLKYHIRSHSELYIKAHRAFFNYDILFPEFIIQSCKPAADWNSLEALVLGTEFSFFKSQQISSLKKSRNKHIAFSEISTATLQCHFPVKPAKPAIWIRVWSKTSSFCSRETLHFLQWILNGALAQQACRTTAFIPFSINIPTSLV